jgi:hypothetical protein
MRMPLTNTPRVINRWWAGVVCVVALLALMIGARTQGNTRDEGYYFEAGELAYGWYGELGDNLRKLRPMRSFSRASVDRWFGYNHEHPALMKSLFGLSWRLFHKCDCPAQSGRHPVSYAKRHHTLGLLSEEAALRLPTQVSVALMAALIFLFAASAWSVRAGFVAAVLSVAAPRLFFDAQLAAFDAPIAAMWVATVYAYHRSLTERRWGWRTGVIFGLALATKHNAFFLPVVLLAHAIYATRDAWLHRKRPFLASVPRAFLWMVLVGPLVYLACWPWLWFDTIARFRDYAAFHVHHVYYNMEYLGTNYNKPPFPLSFPYVMTLFTVPATTLALAVVGGVSALADRLRARGDVPAPQQDLRDGTAPVLLCALNALFPMLILTATRAPIFGATKHWHATIPFLALLAGYGLERLCRGLDGPRLKPALAVLVCLPAVLDTYRSHPYALTHYNLFAGGPQGGADLGLNRQFWGYASRGILPWLNAHAAPSAPIYWHDTNQSQLNMDVREHRLRPDLRNTGLEEPGVRGSDLAMVIHEKHFSKYEYWIWDFYGTTKPLLVLDHLGVPIVTMYQRPGTPGSPATTGNR